MQFSYIENHELHHTQTMYAELKLVENFTIHACSCIPELSVVSKTSKLIPVRKAYPHAGDLLHP